MKKILTIAPILVLFLLSSCGTSRLVNIDPYIGTWNLTVQNTEQGDIGAAMTIIKDENGSYTGNVISDLGNFMLNDLTIENTRLSSKFEVSGMAFDLTGNFNGEDFSGFVSSTNTEYKTVGKKVVDKVL
ncbi:hypothetical protein SAMN03097699_0611 [Flavobacteriaceae bacterium MAR_2010_188]|nr:hypothetical protein SAMN03097699_0611 [Flavobacteriaceae bacterium MAR_2010_188]